MKTSIGFRLSAAICAATLFISTFSFISVPVRAQSPGAAYTAAARLAAKAAALKKECERLKAEAARLEALAKQAEADAETAKADATTAQTAAAEAMAEFREQVTGQDRAA